jgi:hypothetical protein
LFVPQKNGAQSYFKRPTNQVGTQRRGEGISEENRLQRGLMLVVHASREVPCTAFGEDSIKQSAGKLRKTGGTAACQHPAGLKAPVNLIVSLRTDNDEVRGSG